MPTGGPAPRRTPTKTSAFGVGRRESHDSTGFYARFDPPVLSGEERIGRRPQVEGPILGDSRSMADLPDDSVALVVTSPPYFVGKEYETEESNGGAQVPGSYREYLQLLEDVFTECHRVLEPGGRIAVNVANLGRRPYRSLSADVIAILQRLGLLLRGEIIWQKASSSSGSCAWGSFRSPANPVLRDVTERVVVASKGRFDRALGRSTRRRLGLPHRPTTTSDEFMEATLDVWHIPAESARRVGHPAPFPVELPLRLIHLYTYRDDLILDPFMGSGSTLVAAARSDRRAVGYDVDPSYVAMAQARLQQAHPTAGLDCLPSKGTRNLARDILEEAGLRIIKMAPKVGNTGVSYPYLVANRHDQQWYVDIAGGFTSVLPGLQRPAVLWETLGRAHLLSATDSEARLMVMTPGLPRPASPARKTLEALGPGRLFDVVELISDQDLQRLGRYGTEPAQRPLTGFWTRQRIDRDFR